MGLEVAGAAEPLMTHLCGRTREGKIDKERGSKRERVRKRETKETAKQVIPYLDTDFQTTPRR